MIRKHAWQAQILDVIRYVLLPQHPSDLDEVTSRENANLSTIKTGSTVPREIAIVRAPDCYIRSTSRRRPSACCTIQVEAF